MGEWANWGIRGYLLQVKYPRTFYEFIRNKANANILCDGMYLYLSKAARRVHCCGRPSRYWIRRHGLTFMWEYSRYSSFNLLHKVFNIFAITVYKQRLSLNWAILEYLLSKKSNDQNFLVRLIRTSLHEKF